MAGGIIDNITLSCDCGNRPNLIWYYIKGTANRKHYFVKCENCNTRTTNRIKLENAVSDWNNKKYRK